MRLWNWIQKFKILKKIRDYDEKWLIESRENHLEKIIYGRKAKYIMSVMKRHLSKS